LSAIDLKRRAFLGRSGFLLAGATLWLAGCGRSEPRASAAGGEVAAAADTAEVAGADPCNDLTALTKDELALRETFGYVPHSSDPEIECEHCEFYKEPVAGKPCGGCTLFAGPVEPEGMCDSFSAA